jgi:predicted TIM-barrel fold metal-dependent hydrolase
MMCRQLLDEFGVTKAILHPVTDWAELPMAGEGGGVACAALNDWLVAEWLDRDERMYGAISTTVEDGVRAAREIERAYETSKRFVKVMVPCVTREPLGHPTYWPIYEVATGLGLPIGCHVGGFSGAPTATGVPNYYAEQGTAQPHTGAVHVVSLIGSGVFERFPDLQFCIEECGVAWMGPLMWRLDRAWEEMRESMPQLGRRPSDLIREHIWLTTQPLDEPETPQQLAEMFEDLALDDRILFATDYPHWNFDNPDRVLPPSVVGKELREKILTGNAHNLFTFV